MRTDDPDFDAEQESKSPEDAGSEDLPSAQELLDTLFTDSALWPLLTVMSVSVGAIGAGVLVLAFVDHNVFAAAALLLLAGMTIDVGVRARRKSNYRVLAKAVFGLWAVAIALALVAVVSGIA